MSAYHYNEDGSYTVQTNCFECHCKCGALCYVNAEGKDEAKTEETAETQEGETTTETESEEE